MDTGRALKDMASKRSSQDSLILRRFIANLLRLADTDTRDSELLLDSGSHRNAAVLQNLAVAKIIEAVIGSEQQSIKAPPDARIPQQIPLQKHLLTLQGQRKSLPALLPNSDINASPAEADLLSSASEIQSILQELVEHFAVDIDGTAAAKTADPIRPKAAEPLPSLRRKIPTPVEEKQGAATAEIISHPSVSAGKTKLRIKQPPTQVPVDTRSNTPNSSSSGRSVAKFGKVSSTAFWSLVDRWDLADLDALALLGHTDGMTKKGTRPRFRMTESETEMATLLESMDGALAALGLEPRQWLPQPVAEAPFQGTTPMEFMLQQGVPGARKIRHYIMQMSLHASLASR